VTPPASAATPTVGERIAEALARLGVRRVHGVATGLGGLPGIAAPDDLALLLADLDGRCGGVPGVALLDPQLLHVSSQPGGRANPETIADPEPALLRVHHAAREATPHTIALHLDFDLDAPAPIGFADLAVEADGGAPRPPPPRPQMQQCHRHRHHESTRPLSGDEFTAHSRAGGA